MSILAQGSSCSTKAVKLLAALVLSLTSLLIGTTDAKVRVVTTLPDFAAIAKEIGGDLVEAKSIARGYQDPHYIAAKPSYMRLLNRADLLIYNGLELEVGWLPLLLRGARNPKVAVGATGHLQASLGVRILDVPAGRLDRSMGDVHPEGNPHYTVDPRNGSIIAERIAERLSQISPDDTAVFQRNLSRFRTELSRDISRWEDRASDLRGRELFAYHNLWPYLEDWLGLIVVDHVEDKPGIPPGPRHTSALISRMETEGIRVLICASYGDVEAAERFARRAGADLVILPALVGGEPGVETYSDLFEEIITRLLKAFSVR